MTKYLQLTTTETLSFWDDYIEDYVFNPENKLVTTAWYKLPDDWLNAGKLKEDKLEAIFKNLYGENWRQGNDDGSKWRVLRVDENLLSDAQSLQKPWLTEKRLCYVISEDDSIKKCEPDEFYGKPEIGSSSVIDCPSCSQKLRVPNKNVILTCPKCRSNWRHSQK